MRNLKFRTQLIIGFSIILLFSLLFAGYSILQIQKIHSDTEVLYLHPFKVSNKVRDIQINISTIHQIMQDAELAENVEDIDKSIELISYYDSLVIVDFDIIYERFLGDKSLVDSVYVSYNSWAFRRNNLFEMYKSGNLTGAKELIKQNGDVQAELFLKAKELTDFAQQKATDLFLSTEKKQKKSFQTILIVAILLLILINIIAFVFLKNISRPIRKFIKDIDVVLKKETSAGNKFQDHSEQELLSNTVVELKSAYTKLESFNAELEQQVKIRTKELSLSKENVEESERKFKTIFNEAPNGIALIDSHSGFIYEVNPMFAKIVGRSIGDIKTIDWMSITHPEDIHSDLDNMALLNSGEIGGFQMEKRYIKPDGSIAWINLTVAALNVNAYKTKRHLAMIEDITERKHTEEQIRKLSTAVEQSPASVVITDVNGDIEYVNPKFSETTGYSFNEVISKNPRILKSVETPPEVYKELWETITSGKEWKGEFHNKKKNGEQYWELASISPIRNHKGIITHFLAVKEDITKRKKADKELRASEEKYRLLAENIKDVIWIYHVRKNKYKYMSPSVLQMRGFTAEEDKKHSLEERYTPDSAQKAKDAIHRMAQEFISNPKQKKQYYNEFQEIAKDGSLYWIETISQPQYTKKGEVEILGVSRNIEKRKRAEQAMKENEIHLQKLNATKDKFFSIIAHDLKTPFNGIMGFSDLLSEQIQNKDYEGIDKYAQIIQQSSKSAVDLLMNLMEWSRSQTGRLEFTPEYIEIVKLIIGVTELLQGSALQKSISISRNLPRNAVVFADKSMISTILRNLISNAIKFTHQGGKIEISIEQKQKELLVAVKDSGVGINKADIDKLFRIEGKFSKPGTINEKGTGLGLILCKEFVDKHNGEIWVESEIGSGSTFIFTIPNK